MEETFKERVLRVTGVDLNEMSVDETGIFMAITIHDNIKYKIDTNKEVIEIISELTFGQKAVGITFNHGEGPIFEMIKSAKQTCANAIDQMDYLRNHPQTTSGETKALATIAIRDLQKAQMMMVKAITWKD